ncbi:hypothetical protein [Microbacterium rhizomatis]|uniref:DUF559 domain-containing protein n=1 Tax=Microbacterium rhizomatis TaxID=1631477 RepID=A0A5J5J527_9MICO|nr:hypothetical protein [Microbacterium rhizomatis]KAA9111130.1 hypothetical protein F6B43_05845 [Microbacterium rhizomatis]
MPRHDLPEDLGDMFPVHLARAKGVSQKRLRGSDLEKPFHGVRSRLPTSGDVDDLEAASPHEQQRRRIIRAARQYAQRMGPGEFFTHSTAAVIWGAPVPLLSDERPHVAVLAPQRLVRSAGVRAHETQPHLTRVAIHPDHRLPVASPATTWASLAAELRTLYDLVAIGDYFVRIPRMPGGFDKLMKPPLTTLVALEAALIAGRRIGKPLLREALPRVRTGSSSRPETWMRCLVVDAGMPEPILDHDVYDADGTFVGCLDGAYPDVKVALEYEGDHHRTDPTTWNRDIRKHDALAALGWRVVRVTRADVFADPAAFLLRASTALRARR